MDFLVVGVVAFLASLLTFFSGFGLGTLLLPVFVLFFPVPVAIAATGVVHFLNNIFKGTLVWKYIDRPTILAFGLPAIPAAILGAIVITKIDERLAAVLIGTILILFSILELQPWFQKLTFPRRYISLGGILTGFMGGVSGQQGALRSMFLLKSGFSAQQYIATGIFIALLIDLARIPTYFFGLDSGNFQWDSHLISLIMVGTASAFIGAWIGARQLKKVTIAPLRYLVAALMFVIGTMMIFGLI